MNDLSLLRPFDPEAAKAGAPITYKDNPHLLWSYVAGPDAAGNYILRIEAKLDVKGNFTSPTYPEHLRMAPLGWVEGKPVYPGDVLYWKTEKGATFTAGARTLPFGLIEGVSEMPDGRELCRGMSAGSLTWVKPKTRVRGWLNVYALDRPAHIYGSLDAADAAASADRVACIPIEWEE